MTDKHVFVVYSGESDPGRVYHALVYALQASLRGNEVRFFFAGDGTYWPEVLENNHPTMGDMFQKLKERGVIEGITKNCAVAYGRAESGEKILPLVSGPEESRGQIDLLDFADRSYRIWTY
jgi:hypothetical protein